ncbi:hypothetical protein AB2L28_07725 [Kineococcus sp. TBRC 1896]|uniref:Uncharacterized protein n=1 Tax=Kineococcus mangrovi TaxID=1660183 RepID=A0ABV4I0C5_9ACTN
MVTVLFDDQVPVHYGFINLQPDDAEVELDHTSSRGGQANGLCGATFPGQLHMVTGLHTGPVALRLELHPAQPPVPVQWEDVVEVPFTATTGSYWLSAFDWWHEIGILPDTYRVRWCANGMDQAHDRTRMDGEPTLDQYLLQLWPAPSTPDAVIRLGSQSAAYWHREAATTQPPPTPQERAAQRAEQEQQELAAQTQREAAQEVEEWGGRAPTAQLRAVGGRTGQLAHLDRDVVDALAALNGAQQRAVAVWAARRACDVAGITTLDWIEQALDSALRGEPLPQEWADFDQVWNRLFPAPESQSEVEIVYTGRYLAAGEEYVHEPLAPEATAIDAVLQAGEQDAAQAVMGAVDALARGHVDPAVVLLEVRRLAEGSWPSR